MTAARRAAERLLGAATAGERRLTATVSRVDLADGGTVVVKRGQGHGATTTEAASLRWLAEPGTVPVPAVLAADDEWLVLEEVGGGRPAGAAAFGAGLAGLHAAGAPSFGSAPPAASDTAWIGNTTMPIAEGATWGAWYAEHRVLTFLRTAVDAGAMPTSGARTVERVCSRIDELAGPAEAPARLHGDLWSGNVLWEPAGGASLIDPAAHGGHRETDIAMLHLFGCPLLDEILAGYQRVWPFAVGWRARIPLHQLFPLLVHTVLFGGGYGGQAETAAAAALRAG